MTQLGHGIGTGIAGRRERKEKQKQEQSFLKGVEQIMEHDAVRGMFPEHYDPYAVGVEGTMAAIDMITRGQNLRQQQTQTDMAMMELERAQQAQRGQQSLMAGLSSVQRGHGEGLLRPEVMEQYQAMLQDPAIATAAAHGMPPEVARLFFPQGEAMSPLDQARTEKTMVETERIRREMDKAPEGFESPEEARAALQRMQVPGQVTQRSDGKYSIQFQDPGPEAARALEKRIVPREELDKLMEQYNILAHPLEDGTYRLESVRPIREDFLDSLVQRGFQAGGGGRAPGEGTPAAQGQGDLRSPQQQPPATPRGVLEQSLDQQFGR